MDGSELYYWDSCIFLAWLRNENRKEGEMEAVKAYVRKINRREIQIMTSAIAYTEVTATRLPVGVDQQFFDLMRSTNVKVVSADIRITKLARDLRDYYFSRSAEFNKKTLCTPDAIHLATAILYKAKEFHTFDGSNQNGSLGLLNLNGDVGGHELIVCKPESDQRELNI